MEDIVIPVPAPVDDVARVEAEEAVAVADNASEVAVEAVEAVEELKDQVQAIQEDQSWHAAMELRIAALERKISEASGMMEALLMQSRQAAPEPEPEPEEAPEAEEAGEDIEVVEDRVATPPPAHVQRRLQRSRKLF